MYAFGLAFSCTCDTVFSTCSSLNHDKFMFKVPFWNHTSGGACPKTPHIHGNQDKRFSVSAFPCIRRFKSLVICGINSKNIARFFTGTTTMRDNRPDFFVISYTIFHFLGCFRKSSWLECVISFVMKYSVRPPDSIAFLNQDISLC